MDKRPSLNTWLHVATLLAALAAAWGSQGTRISELETRLAAVETQVNQIPALAVQIHDLKEEIRTNGVQHPQ